MTTPRVTVPVEPEFTHYRRSQIAHLRPYVSGETLSDRVSISAADLEAGSPKPGDMIARNPDNHDDQWLVAADYFAANFEPISAAPAPEGGAVKTACVDFQEAIDDFEAEVADVMAEGSERADLWDREITVNIDALKTVMSAALATREEAPAEAGFVVRLQDCLDAAGEACVSVDTGDLRSALSALRAQPQAREEAQPVAWRWQAPLKWKASADPDDADFVRKAGVTVQPLYTTPPAPEAEKMRILDVVGDYLIQQYGYSYGLHHPVDRKRILAALQQEGR